MDDAGIEELLDELAERIEQSKPVLGNSQKRRSKSAPSSRFSMRFATSFPRNCARPASSFATARA